MHLNEFSRHSPFFFINTSANKCELQRLYLHKKIQSELLSFYSLLKTFEVRRSRFVTRIVTN